jgi:hypothetical protein
MEMITTSSTSSEFSIYSGKMRWSSSYRGRGMTLQFSGTGGNYDCFSLNVNILGKTVVLHLAHFCGWGCVISSLQFI